MAFDSLVDSLTPSQEAFSRFQAYLITEQRKWQSDKQGRLDGLAADIAELDAQIEALIDRIVKSDSEALIAAYENRPSKLERQKFLAQEAMD